MFALHFLPHDAMLARYILSSSVRLSHAGIVSKRLNAELNQANNAVR